VIYSDDAERSILGAILLDEGLYDETLGLGLEIADFGLDAHKTIFLHFELLSKNGSSLDPITLIDSLGNHRELERIGGLGYVSDLTSGVPDRPSIRSYVKIVKEHAAKRKLRHACAATVDGLAEEMESSDAVEYLTEQMLQIQSGSDDAPAQKVIEFTERTYQKWLTVAAGDASLIGLSTGINCLDTTTTGIRERELWVIGGRTGDGKTNLALQAVAANCRNNIPVGVFSVEMPKESILHRLWAGEGQVDFNHIRFPRRLSTEVKHRIELAMTEIADWPLHVVEESGISIQKLVSKAKLMVRKSGVKLIVVDYVQLVTSNGRDERERITRISKSLQALAKDTGVPVLALSQLSRPKDGNENYRPVKYSLKESGSLENDPDVIILIYRPVDERKMKTREDELIVEKQRSGLPSIEKVTFLPWLRFGERES
jgi:replicative DNA helicase